MTDIEELIRAELSYFDSEQQRQSLQAFLIDPTPSIQAWQYGAEKHACIIIAQSGNEQLVYCPTGFGPAFPWSVQPLGTGDLGTDGGWSAHLYEAVVTSKMWPSGPPVGFVHMARGERLP